MPLEDFIYLKDMVHPKDVKNRSLGPKGTV